MSRGISISTTTLRTLVSPSVWRVPVRLRPFSSTTTPQQQFADMDAAAFGEQHIARGIGRLTKHVFEDGKGTWITTDKGVKLLDMTAGIGVVNLGHCHPKVSAAAAAQCSKITHAQVNIGFSAAQIALIRELIPILPHESLDTIFLWNSGAEAVEAAVKLARAATKKPNIIVMQGSYHGRTNATASMTRSKTIYGEGHGPLMGGVFATAFPYYSQFGLPATTPTEELVEQSLLQLRLTLSQQTAPSDTAAIILEPILGEGGYVPAPPAFLAGLRQVCDEHNILLIADEVQSGMGRTGPYWAVQNSGVRPDILIFAKGVANGFPLSGIAASKSIMDLQKPGSMGGTYAGNAVSCAAATACIKAFREEKILDNVAKRSEQIFSFLRDLQKSGSKAGSLIEDIRGSGLMVGVQFANPALQNGSSNVAARHAGNQPQIAPKVVQECVKRDMLILSTSVFDVIRFIPPLNISEEEMTKGLGIFKESLEAVAKDL
ncbi:4-aminobutyrate aminotransferase [Pyrenophora tritici-repentis]|uniref:4-aminobutyrate aminotransferase n=1 Tax=Pyrenophora tritici-repentis TaxID=45151 RepID=A0A2W1GNQ1_9PLEO|nr:4-aminobutyrate aminotransferase [Pyrenophora tritici-repentis]KAF7451892.1 4-aminobutyrate aminotransferase [Pyrenophora tritici-repentis]KAF7574984.1 GabT, 4-aminobutyrate aminotransferase and related aminotransferase [Pyrenophora tritici-repentis]KAG9386250.1 4-aminobutyrate aminotransferase [Pyrenophora tritici-repentis]KAI1519038.1 4-aminobutyrate aminotransferase [Pyrenophora tritici-repentis]